jgi:very-short-patch-repair endonuclease
MEISEQFRVIQGQKAAKEKLELAKKFRRVMTPAERKLWSRLRSNQVEGWHFRKQQVVAGFIVDFICCRAKVVVEVDGEIHDYTVKDDELKDKVLAEKGFRVVRIKNRQIFSDMNQVIETIAKVCREMI